MEHRFFLALVLAIYAPAAAVAQVSGKDCVDFAKVIGVNQSKNTFARSLQSTIFSKFCENKQFNRTGNSSVKAELIYETLFGSFDSGNGTAEFQMDKFCSTFDTTLSDNVNTTAEQRLISDRAVAGFETCVKAASLNITVKPVVSQSHISISFGSGGNPLKIISLAASKNLKCSGNDGKGSVGNIGPAMVVNLAAGEIAKFDCDRSTTKDGKSFLQSDFSIGIGVGGFSDTIPISLPGDNLVTPASANDLRSRIDDLAGKLDKQGIVFAFAAKDCPFPWKLYQPAIGRFVRGIDPNGIIDPDGKRSFGSLQADAIVGHTHTMGINGGDSSTMVPGGAAQRLAQFNGDQFGGGPPKQTNETIGGEKETRPKNVALLYCILN